MENCKFIIIAAVSVDGVIGIGNEMPWRIPEDFQHFRKTTMNNMLLVGYNTFITLPPKAFEGREYMVANGHNPISNTSKYCYHFYKLETILELLKDKRTDVDKVFIAGGARIYDAMIDYADEAIITWVNKNYPEGDKRFPIEKLFANFDLDKDDGWQLSKNNILFKITHYRKR